MLAVGFVTDRKIWKITYHLVRTLLELLLSPCGSPLELYDDGIITFLSQILYFIELEPHTRLVFYWRDIHVFSLCSGLGKNTKKSFKTIYSKFHLAYSLCYACVYTSQFWRQVGVARLTHCHYSLPKSITFLILRDYTLWLIQRTYRRYFYTTWKGNPSSFLPPNSGWWAKGKERKGRVFI